MIRFMMLLGFIFLSSNNFERRMRAYLCGYGFRMFGKNWGEPIVAFWADDENEDGSPINRD